MTERSQRYLLAELWPFLSKAPFNNNKNSFDSFLPAASHAVKLQLLLLLNITGTEFEAVSHTAVILFQVKLLFHV